MPPILQVIIFRVFWGQQYSPELNYPDEAPANYTARMLFRPNNHLFYLVRDLNNKLGNYIVKYRSKYNQNFKMQDFVDKFLHNKNLTNIVYFFVYNFLYLFDEGRNTRRDLLQNDFSRLKALDTFFNLSLIIDEVLRWSHLQATGNNINKMKDGVIWLCDKNQWMNQHDLEEFWGQNYLRINSDGPHLVIPKLLEKTELYQNNPVRNEVFVILTSYHLRNYSGHNISQENILTSRYDEIIEQLLMALFLSVDSI